MRRTTLVALIALGALLAGCVDENTPEPTTPGADPTVYADDRIQIQTIAESAIEPPTLEKAPNWQLGEWWKVELTDGFVGRSYSSYIVVAGAEPTSYLVGMPTHDFSNDLMVLHIPGFGQVNKTDLSFEVHDCPYHPVKFPLVEDATWETQFECRDVVATVDSIDGDRATINLIGPNDNIRVVYDAAMRTIVEMEKQNYAIYNILDHGYDFAENFPGLEGIITVPHMHDVIFQHGRLFGAVGFNPLVPDFPLGPAGPFDTVAVDTTYDRVSFVIILGSLGLPTDALPVGGYYRERALAPDGTAYDQTLMPNAGQKLDIWTYKHDNPGGDWEFEHYAGGPGIAMAEGIAYHVYDVEIATGRILPSIGEHQHGEHDGH